MARRRKREQTFFLDEVTSGAENADTLFNILEGNPRRLDRSRVRLSELQEEINRNALERQAQDGMQRSLALAKELGVQDADFNEEGTFVPRTTPAGQLAEGSPESLQATPAFEIDGQMFDPVAARQSVLKDESRRLKGQEAIAKIRSTGRGLVQGVDENQNLIVIDKDSGISSPVLDEKTGQPVKAPKKPVSGKSVLIKNKATGSVMSKTLGEGESVPEGFEVYTSQRVMGTNPQSLRKEINAEPIVKQFKDIRLQFQRMQDAMQESQTSGSMIAVDQALISVFNKMLDPESVVRESEYARTPSDQAMLNRLKGKLEKLSSGGAGLTSDERQALQRMSERFFKASQRNYDESIDFYSEVARQSGIDPGLVIQPLTMGERGTKSIKTDFDTEEEAESANLPKGTVVTIGGVRHIKE